MDNFTLGEVALLSEEAALRRGADAHNLTRIRMYLTVFAIVAIGEMLFAFLSPRVSAYDRILATVNLLLLIVAAGTGDVVGGGANKLSRHFTGIAAVVSRNVRPWIIGILAVQYLLFMVFASRAGWPTWAFLFPAVTFGFRFLAPEFVLLHGFFVAVAIVEGLLVWQKSRMPLIAILVIATTSNAIMLLVSFVSARRFKRDFLGRWRAEHESAVDRARMRDELHYARELQLSMLPSNPPDLPWLDVAAISLPATEVGGDYFDYFPISDRRLAIVCGDVAGHGLGSGIVLAALRAGFTLLRDSLDDPVYVLRRLDELVTETSRRRMLVSLAILILDEERHVATIASAGHPPLIFRNRDGASEAIEMFSPPLGVKLRQVLVTREIPFAKGDAFILHTDGIYEASNARDDAYGFDRLTQLASRTTGDAAAMRDAIVADVASFRGAVPQADDITIVVARVTR
ncbi:MAG TPA: PP2C family protein-serine/threonine phosphatase [Thermoanaerobaculia bacterium]|nr:PP2C family protein-serine/threonine phosphatase [Thermoanaerobaculia bacterium]